MSCQLLDNGPRKLRRINGKPVNKKSPVLTKKQGEKLLRRDLAMIAKAVHWLGSPKLTPNQFLATVSLIFNISSDNFRAPVKFVKGYCVTITMELPTSGGSGKGMDQTGVFCHGC